MPQFFKPNITHLGRCTYSYSDISVANPEETVIGSFVSIGKGVCVGQGNHPQNYLSTSPYTYLNRMEFKSVDTPDHPEWEQLKPVHIGNDVWIGDGVWIKNAITIGDGAIIGAKAVVTHDVPPYAVVTGIPAKVLKYRFAPEIITELLRLKWWDLPDEVIKALPFDNISTCLTKLKEIRDETL